MTATLRMPLVCFSKHFQRLTVDDLVEKAAQLGFEGYDLCCRPGYAINPDNVRPALPKAVRQFRKAGLVVPIVTGSGDLLEPTDRTAEPILAAMHESDIALLKLGYFRIHNATEDYWEKVAYIRRQFEGWAKLGEKFGVKICYHTHSHPAHMGLNAAAVMHLVQGFDPRWIGVYLDPGHLLIDGEHPDIAFNMVKRYLAIVALKDARKESNPIGGGYRQTLCRAGLGSVDWANVFENLRRVKFDGPLSVHAEYNRHYPHTAQGEAEYVASLKDEFAFFKRLRDRA
jgi:sugar phosphate isomerase/epimerase